MNQTAQHSDSIADIWHENCHELGEGPVAHPDRSSVLWFDIPHGLLYERPFAGGHVREHRIGAMASVAALVDRRHVLVATEKDFRLLNLDTGASNPVRPFLADHPHLRSNDGRVHPSGALWISSMGKCAEPEQGAIWWFRDGELRLLFDRITIGNSICFGPGGRVAYFADSASRTIWRVATDPDTGLPIGEPAVFKRYADIEGEPDGAVVDADGRIWSAAWGASAVHVWNADATLYDSYALPVSQPTCPAFFGEHFDRLLITSAHQNLSPEARLIQPMAGAVWKLRKAVRGVPEPYVRLG
jgi:sugar lactone lactonase YvrE